MVNAILGEERVIAFDMAGTTRDSIHIDFEREGKPFTIIDTAGVRRRGKVDEAVEKFSVIKAMQAVEAANVAVLVLDAQQDIADQDATIAGLLWKQAVLWWWQSINGTASAKSAASK